MKFSNDSKFAVNRHHIVVQESFEFPIINSLSIFSHQRIQPVLIMVFALIILFSQMGASETSESAPSASSQLATVIWLQGDVRIMDANQVNLAKRGDILKQGQQILTGPNGRCVVSYLGLTAKINYNSSLRFNTLDSSVRAQLNQGRVVNSVRKTTRNDTYQINTMSVVAGVRGTKFIVDYAGDKDILFKGTDEPLKKETTRIFVIEGEVAVTQMETDIPLAAVTAGNKIEIHASTLTNNKVNTLGTVAMTNEEHLFMKREYEELSEILENPESYKVNENIPGKPLVPESKNPEEYTLKTAPSEPEKEKEEPKNLTTETPKIAASDTLTQPGNKREPSRTVPDDPKYKETPKDGTVNSSPTDPKADVVDIKVDEVPKKDSSEPEKTEPKVDPNVSTEIQPTVESPPVRTLDTLSKSEAARFFYTNLKTIQQDTPPDGNQIVSTILPEVVSNPSSQMVSYAIGKEISISPDHSIQFKSVNLQSYVNKVKRSLPELEPTLLKGDLNQGAGARNGGLIELDKGLYLWVPIIEYQSVSSFLPEEVTEAYNHPNCYYIEDKITILFESTPDAIKELNERAYIAAEFKIKQKLDLAKIKITQGTLWITDLRPNVQSISFIPDTTETPISDASKAEPVPTKPIGKAGVYQVAFSFKARINTAFSYHAYFNPPPPPPIVFNEVKGSVWVQPEGKSHWMKVEKGQNIPFSHAKMVIAGTDSYVRLSTNEKNSKDIKLPKIFGDVIVFDVLDLFDPSIRLEHLLEEARYIKKEMVQSGLMFDIANPPSDVTESIVKTDDKNLFNTFFLLYKRGEYQICKDSILAVLKDRSLPSPFHLLKLGCDINLLNFEVAMDSLTSIGYGAEGKTDSKKGTPNASLDFQDHVEYVACLIDFLKKDYKKSLQNIDQFKLYRTDSAYQTKFLFLAGMNWKELNVRFRAVECFNQVKPQIVEFPMLADLSRREINFLYHRD